MTVKYKNTVEPGLSVSLKCLTHSGLSVEYKNAIQSGLSGTLKCLSTLSQPGLSV